MDAGWLRSSLALGSRRNISAAITGVGTAITWSGLLGRSRVGGMHQHFSYIFLTALGSFNGPSRWPEPPRGSGSYMATSAATSSNDRASACGAIRIRAPQLLPDEDAILECQVRRNSRTAVASLDQPRKSRNPPGAVSRGRGCGGPMRTTGRGEAAFPIALA